MSFTITMYKNNSESNRMTKNLTSAVSVTGTLRQSTSIIDPVIQVRGNIESVVNHNYLHIPKFNRYYFINNITSIRDDLYEISCHVDVLMSHKNGILNEWCIVARQSNNYSLYLNDTFMKTYNYDILSARKFPQSFTGSSLVLAVAGSGD